MHMFIVPVMGYVNVHIFGFVRGYMSAKYIEFQYRQYKDIIKNNQDPSTIKFMSDKFKSADDFGNAYFEIRDKYLETEY